MNYYCVLIWTRWERPAKNNHFRSELYRRLRYIALNLSVLCLNEIMRTELSYPASEQRNSYKRMIHEPNEIIVAATRRDIYSIQSAI